jgi:peptidoglycan/xylan/chitin deacetylase (PgdA/CDA1 family)
MLRPIIRWAAARGGTSRLSIFIYHRVLPAPDPLFPGEVDAAQFDAQVAWITRWFTVLPLADAVRRMQHGDLPPGAAAITFDDGYADNLHQAEPVLRQHGACATLFVATGFLDGGCMWNDRVIEAVRRTRQPVLALPDLWPQPLPVADLAQRRTAIGQLIGHIKYLPMHARDRAVAEVVRAAAVAVPDDLMLTSAELRRWHAAGQQVGAHTVNHPILAQLTDEAARDEISLGRDALQALLDSRIGLFAYPNGRPGSDYLPVHVDMVRTLGFDAAFSTTWGAATARSPGYELPRFTPWDRSRLRFGARLVRNLLAA